MPVDHYENFPVASVLLPARMREPIEAIYAFARGADDIADEGDAGPEERLAGLRGYREALERIERGEAPGAGFERIAEAVARHRLPVALLRDLLDAFAQDVVKPRYADFAELLDYCRRSANPIGRLLLHLFGQADAMSLRQSDAICTSLQLINFWQDVGIDWDKGRVYIPCDELARFGVAEDAIAGRRADGAWPELMAFQCDRARALLASGAALGRTLPGRLGLEIRAVSAGGSAILDKIDRVRGDVFRHRPTLGARDWVLIVTRALLFIPDRSPRTRAHAR